MKRQQYLESMIDGLGAAGMAVSAAAKHFEVRENVRAALASIEGGAELDHYFGITSRHPRQSRAAAAHCFRLVGTLFDSKVERSFTRLETDPSGADPEALRALMYGRRTVRMKGDA